MFLWRIARLSPEKTVFQPLPNTFEAGTGNIADAAGLGAAIDYVNRIGMENIARYEHELLCHGMRLLGGIVPTHRRWSARCRTRSSCCSATGSATASCCTTRSAGSDASYELLARKR